MDKQRHIFGRHSASLQQFHAVHQMLLPGWQLLCVDMVNAQIVLHRPEFSGPQPGLRVTAEALNEHILRLPVHRRICRPLVSALSPALLFTFTRLKTLQRAVYLSEELPGLVLGAEWIIFWVISGFYISKVLGVGEFVADSSPHITAEGRHVGLLCFQMQLTGAFLLHYCHLLEVVWFSLSMSIYPSVLFSQ